MGTIGPILLRARPRSDRGIYLKCRARTRETVPTVQGEPVDLREAARVGRDFRSGVEILELKAE